MLRTAVNLASKNGVAKHVRAFATPASSLSSNSAPGPFPSGGVPSQSSGNRHDGVKNNYWDANPKTKKDNNSNANDTASKTPIRQGLMQSLYF